MPNAPQPNQPEDTPAQAMIHLIPRPAHVEPRVGSFQLTPAARIGVAPASPELVAIGAFLAGRLGMPTPGEGAGNGILLTTADADPALGEEGYELSITPDSVSLKAYRPAGLFWGVQTLLQLLPSAADGADQALPAGLVRDTPRFAWRGIMLDVGRHFHPVADVERLMDLAAAFKLNRFHLHLSDDQGWRLMIRSWPELALKGGTTQVGGGPGGYYTQEEYAGLDAYARQRYMTLVPEIDLPGHTNAVLACYPELNCDGKAPELYSGIEVGFSSLCIEKEVTYRFLSDVIGEIAALTSGPYIHIGGDEAHATQLADYQTFIARVQAIVQATGKRMVGWEEIGQARLAPESIAQIWNGEKYPRILEQGNKVIFSLAKKTYIDMKYDPSTPIGYDWAGYISVKDGYAWDPDDSLPGIREKDILGIEAALWCETVRSMDDVEYLTFPRLPGLAEIAWSPAQGRGWDEYRQRLAALGPWLRAQGVNFYPAPEIDWK